MKKFLSLVLALVMTMSLVTISAGAKDFTDDSKIKYEEAVDVVSELKIVDGYKDGSFNPTGTLTRGAAAKIICNLLLGPTTASALSADTAPYKDVPANHEFAGYIAYCAQKGIISGYADGTFRPTGTLTGYAFMKMLLGALGYDATIEGYTGANWSVNVAKQALGIELDDGNDNFVGIQAVTREEAALYSFNTLKADMVDYQSKTEVQVNGATVTIGNSKAYPVSNTLAKDYRDGGPDRDEVMQFCEKYFTDLELRVSSAKDAFGRPANVWYNDKDKIGTYAKEADATYTKDVKAKDIYADLDLSDPYDYKLVIDGDDTLTTFPVIKRDDQLVLGNDADRKINKVVQLALSSTYNYLGNGSLIEVYKDEQVITVVNTYLMQVAGDYDEKDEELTITEVDSGTEMKAPLGGISDYDLSSDDFDNLDTFKDEDYVLVTVANGVVKSIAPAEKVTGALTEYVHQDTVTVGGTEYSLGYANDYADTKGFDLKTDYDVYLDSNGYVLYVDGVENDGNYVYIGEFAKSSGTSASSKALGYGYFLDGTDDEITIEKIDTKKTNGSTVASGVLTMSDLTTTYGPGWYKFSSKESSGKYTLTSLTNVGGTAFGGSPSTDYVVNYGDHGVSIVYDGTGSSLKGNANTKFVILENDGDVKVYTGIKNVAKVTPGSTTAVTVFTDGSSTYAKYVFIDLNNGAVKGGATSSDVLFLLKFDKAGNDADDNEFYRYKAILNGEEKTVKIDVTNKNLGGVLYGEVEYDSDGYITDMTAVDRATPVAGSMDIKTGLYSAYYDDDDYTFANVGSATVTQKNKTITFGGGDSFYMADGAKIYLIENTDEVSTISMSRLASKYKSTALPASSTVTGVYNADGEYSALYVLVKP